MWKEFKAFISRGNVLDLAVGVIIGGAFGKIVNSLINDLLMPPLGYLIGGVNFTDIKINLGSGILEKPVTMNVGNFIQVTLEFLILAFAVFLIVKGFNAMQKKQAEAPAPPTEPSSTDKLLMEIRDALKK
jgi:large conductance mechanosensitive channel